MRYVSMYGPVAEPAHGPRVTVRSTLVRERALSPSRSQFMSHVLEDNRLVT
jgi:hypothetical protein